MSRDVTMLPQYSTMLFTDVWDNEGDFQTEFLASPFGTAIHHGEAKPSPETGNYPNSVNTVFYLLYARYGNSPIANRDVNQFKYKVFTIIFQYGPTWEKRLDIQEKLRAISDDDLLIGSKAIYNSAQNPSTAPSTSALSELPYINQQDTTNYKKSKMDAYAQLWMLLDNDVTGDFLNKFKVCFKQFVAPERPLVYVTEDDEDEGE